MKFYGTMLCPDTVHADKVLRKNGIDIEYIDITSSMKNMKEFLALRDSRSEFDTVKENGKAGVPAFLLDDGSVEFDVMKLDGVTEAVIDELSEKSIESSNDVLLNSGDFKGCSIDGVC